MLPTEFTPKLWTLYKKGTFTKASLAKDILSGLIVGVVALPLAIAFAIASGVTPDKGLVTAVVAGFIISALGGSRVQIGGPTGAFIVIVYAIVQKHGVEGLTIATFMAGFLILGMGLTRMGNLLKFVPYPLIVGFTSGIALIIFSSQVKDFLGLVIETPASDFIEKWMAYAHHLHQINWVAFTMGIGTVLLIFYFPKITGKIPGSLIAVVLATALTRWFHLPVETIESKFGDIPNHFTLPAVPHINLQIIRDLIQPAIAIALLGGIESLLSAVVADGMIGGKHRSNMELVAQGFANIASALFGGIPATGAIARTATNIKNGGRTPVAGVVHALTLLVIILIFAPYAKLIPLPCLAGILVVVSYHMGEWRLFFKMLKSNPMDVTVLLTTFFLTVIFDLVLAIEVGMVLSSFIFMKRMSDTMTVRSSVNVMDSDGNGEYLFEEELKNIPEGVFLYEINGPLFFGATQKFQETLQNMYGTPKVLILRMRHVPFIDATGAIRLKELLGRFQSRSIHVLLSGLKDSVKTELEKLGVTTLLPPESLFSDIQGALERAKVLSPDTLTSRLNEQPEST